MYIVILRKDERSTLAAVERSTMPPYIIGSPLDMAPIFKSYRVGSALVTLAINLDRCHTIVFSPTRRGGVDGARNRHLLLAAVAFAVIFNAPRHFEIAVEARGNETRLVPTGKCDGLQNSLEHGFAGSFGHQSTIVFSPRHGGVNGTRNRRLLLAVVAFAVVFNAPRHFEIAVEARGNKTRLVPTGKCDGRSKLARARIRGKL